MQGLVIGTKGFSLPEDAVTQTFAFMGIRGSGKTTAAAVLAEEMCKAKLPWIAFDPVGVWWGMKSRADGKGPGLPVVVIGGEHGDLPLDRLGGAALAHALVTEPLCAVLDLSGQSNAAYQTVIADFALELMQIRPAVATHLFIEEAPRLVPQHAFGEQKRSKAAIEALIGLGRNRGYGASLITQRPATVDKDVLTQCENLFVLRTAHPIDRKVLHEWIEGHGSPKSAVKFLEGLANLKSGEAWCWSPSWLNHGEGLFERVNFRARETFHPGATRSARGEIGAAVKLQDVGEAVERLRGLIKAAPKAKDARIPASRGGTTGANSTYIVEVKAEPAYDALSEWKQRTAKAESETREIKAKLEKVKAALKPQHDALVALFSELGTQASGAADAQDPVWQTWLDRARKAGAGKVLSVLLEHGSKSRAQLKTLATIQGDSTFRKYISWLKRHGLILVEGDVVSLVQP